VLGTMHLPQMVFGDNFLELVHEATGLKIHFNALDALRGWRQESLPPVQIPAAAKWTSRTYGLLALVVSHASSSIYGSLFRRFWGIIRR
jgi:type 2A phosphatase activator TIP41